MDDIPIPLPAKPERFMDRFRTFMRAKHLTHRTEKTYCHWVWTSFVFINAATRNKWARQRLMPGLTI